MKDIYIKFQEDCLNLFKEEQERLKIDFDPTKQYSLEELSDLISYTERDHNKIQEWLKYAGDQLRELWQDGDPPNQEGINEGYKLLATKISERKGGPLHFDESNIESIAKKANQFDERCENYCNQRFTFYRPEFGNKIVGEDGNNTINLRIDDAYLKYEAFFGASLSTFCHLLRNVCKSEIGFLSRMILSRALIEVSIHNLFVIRKLNGISNRIEKIEPDKAIEEIELFKNHFLRGMFGTKSPETSDEFPDPYNIFTCMDGFKKEPLGELTHEKLLHFYEHLCDYTHPNYLMRNVLSEVGPAKGDYFSYEVFIDKTFEGKQKAPQIFHYLLQAIDISIEILEASFVTKEETRKLLDKKNVSNKEKYQSNWITGRAREFKDKKEA